jgi:hypothetical protein
MANHGLRVNFAFLNQKVQFRLRAGGELLRRFDEETTRAKVANARNVVATLAVPIDIGVFRHHNSGAEPTGRNFALRHVLLPNFPWARNHAPMCGNTQELCQTTGIRFIKKMGRV